LGIGFQVSGFRFRVSGFWVGWHKPPQGKEGNWLETVPSSGWFTILRVYGPLEPWINKTWRPSEIELVE
jgi:hypothetical protein